MTVNVHDLSIGINVKTAHCMVHLGPEADSVKRRRGDGVEIIAEWFAKHGIISSGHSFIVQTDRLI